MKNSQIPKVQKKKEAECVKNKENGKLFQESITLGKPKLFYDSKHELEQKRNFIFSKQL